MHGHAAIIQTIVPALQEITKIKFYTKNADTADWNAFMDVFKIILFTPFQRKK